MSEAAKEIIFVLGMHRSGTSLVAELVANSGYAVPGRMLDIDPVVNAHGFWESQEVVDINERLLQEVGFFWFDPIDRVDVGDFSAGIHAETLRQIKSFLSFSLLAHNRLVIKDPRLCYTLPAWLKCLSANDVSLRFIWVDRDSAAISRSLSTRDGFSELTGILLCLSSLFSAFTAAAGMPCLVLNYDRLLQEDGARHVLADFLRAKPLPLRAWSRIADPGLKRSAVKEFPALSVFLFFRKCQDLLVHGSLVADDVYEAICSFRKLHELFLQGGADWLLALRQTNRALVQARSQAVDVGLLHTKALETIAAKDEQIDDNVRYINKCHEYVRECELRLADMARLQEIHDHHLQVIADREGKIAENVDYISRCEKRIGELDHALKDFDALRARLHEVEVSLRQREDEVAHNATYIGACDIRIAELDDALRQFDAVRARLTEVESILRERDMDVERNTAYIATCESHIRELDAALTEFAAVRLRLAEVESTLRERDADIERNTAYIATCEAHIRELDGALQQFEAVRARLAEVESTLRERDADVERNTAYIATCESHIRELDGALQQFEAVRLRLAEVESTLRERDADVERNTAYIATCESHIRELDGALQQFEAVRLRLAEVESTLRERDADVAQNTEYIVRCETHIREQDALILELGKIQEWSELARVELEKKDMQLEADASIIDNQNRVIEEVECELHAARAENQLLEVTLKAMQQDLDDKLQKLKSLSSELAATDLRLRSLLSWRLVRLLERRMTKQ